MTKSFRKKLTLFLLTILALAMGCFALSSFNLKGAYAIFEYNSDDVFVTKEQALSTNFLGGAKGYMFSTKKNGASVALKHGAAGKFSIEFSPYSSVTGYSEFSSFTFNFSSESARLGFSFEFVPDENGVKMSVSFSNAPLIKRYVLFDGAFDNTSDKPIAFSFDPSLMRVYNASGMTVADFQSPEYMKNFDMITLIDSYERYSLDMVFGGIEQGKIANVIVFELCGQKFDNAELNNSSAPVIFRSEEFSSGVIGKPYAIRKDFPTFDVKDGFSETFNGEISVTDAMMSPVDLSEGDIFTPSECGVYYINYAPVDSDGMKGEIYTYPVYIFEKQPEIEFVFKYPVEDVTVGAGTCVSFGSVYAKTELSAKPLAVKGEIKTQSETIYSVSDCADGFAYTFKDEGTYDVTFSAVDFVNYSSKKTVSITVTNSAVFKNTDLKDVYARDVSINFSSVYASMGSSTVAAKSLVIYPDGRTNDSGVVVLDEEGVYRVIFSAEISGTKVSETKYFTVRNDNVTLWQEQDGLTVVSNSKAPAYADDDYCGTMLTVTRPIEAVYRNVIDLSDNTSDDMLIELFVAPVIAGSIETSCIDIILTDIYDSEKVLDIRLTRDAWKWDSMKSKMSVIAQPKRDFDLDYLNEVCTGSSNYQHYYYYAQSVYASLYGKIDNNNESSVSQSVKLYFDYETGKLYANMAAKNAVKGKVCVADLSNEQYVGTGKAWKKFTTGEAKLSVKISSLAQTANVMILNIDGQNMSGTYTTDTTAPSVFIDFAGNAADSIPYGIKGQPYKIFTAYSRDIAEGLKNNLTVNVYKNDGGNFSDVENNGNEFIPLSTGEYVIRYKAADEAGNSTVKDIKIMVKEAEQIPVKSYRFNPQLLSEVSVGSRYFYKAGTPTGGTGVLRTDVTILKDGKRVELDENNSFIISEAGTYSINVVVADYIGASEPLIYEITADYSDNPIIYERTMPKAIIQGEKFIFPEFSAIKYTESGEESVNVEYFVNGEKLSSGEYTPNNSETLNVQVKAGDAMLEYEIAVTASETGKQYVTRYFYTNAEQKVIERSATFTFGYPAFVSVIKPVSVDFAKFTISSEVASGTVGGSTVTYGAGENLSRIDFTLTDAVNPDISFSASIYKKDTLESFLEYRGVRYVIVNAVFSSYAKNFQVEFDKNTNSLFIGGKNICTITHCDNGNVFNGFSGGAVYLDLYMPEVENNGLAAIGIVEFAGQKFDVSKTSSKSKPSLKVLGDFDAVEIGEDFIIPAANAFDFMNDIKTLKVTVTSPDGNVLLQTDDISQDRVVNAYKCGTFKVVYEAKNSAGISNTRNFSVTVMDRVPPVITLSGEVVKAAKLNSQVTLPTMIVSDDNTPTEEIVTYVYVIAPNAASIRVEDYKFTPDRRGTYTIIYYAADNDKAISTEIFYLVVG